LRKNVSQWQAFLLILSYIGDLLVALWSLKLDWIFTLFVLNLSPLFMIYYRNKGINKTNGAEKRMLINVKQLEIYQFPRVDLKFYA
jgi:hypothetical protein